VNSFESKIIQSIQSIGTRFLDGFFRVVTQLGSVWAVLLVAVLFLILFGLRGTVRYLFILGVTSAFGGLIKLITARPRPYFFSVEIMKKTDVSGYSFISGHTLTIVITALSIYFMISRVLRDTKTIDKQSTKVWLRVLMFTLLTALTLLVGFSRVYLGVHYISDVLFAILFGVVFYYVLAFVYDKYLEKLVFREARDAVHK